MTTEFQIGDHVRFTGDGADGSEWHVAFRSYGTNIYDLMNCDPKAATQFRNGVEPELLVKIERLRDSTGRSICDLRHVSVTNIMDVTTLREPAPTFLD
jgi:hypothetical protein